jgi:serine/threonine protein kinase
MHFLHSSGIVHRDLKSLNLLLDSKWNLKVTKKTKKIQPVAQYPAGGAQVSDFGLTRLCTDLKMAAGFRAHGSLALLIGHTAALVVQQQKNDPARRCFGARHHPLGRARGREGVTEH